MALQSKESVQIHGPLEVHSYLTVTSTTFGERIVESGRTGVDNPRLMARPHGGDVLERVVRIGEAAGGAVSSRVRATPGVMDAVSLMRGHDDSRCFRVSGTRPGLGDGCGDSWFLIFTFRKIYSKILKNSKIFKFVFMEKVQSH